MATALHKAASSPESRSVEILGQIKGVFSQKGFDGASMQDLARAAGMSAGNFYRYFSSKNAIVEAMVAYDLADIEADFATVMSSADPVAALRSVIARRIDMHDPDDGTLWAEIEAASTRRPEIAAISARLETLVAQNLIRVFARISRRSETEASVLYRAHATLFMILIKGTVIQTCGHGGQRNSIPSPELKALVLRTIDSVISEIAGDPAEPTPETEGPAA